METEGNVYSGRPIRVSVCRSSRMEEYQENMEDEVMDENSVKSVPSAEGVTYYAVHIPNTDITSPRLYTDKENALKEVKKHKKARFKPFKTRLEAVNFSMYGSDGAQSHDTLSTEVDGILVNTHSSVKSNGLSGVIADAEKPSSFKGPKAQDLVKLRAAIDNGNLKLVKHTIWDNPRYLVSSGDTPAILQEGSRYNALHIAAKSKNAAMAELILETVGNPDFFRLLYNFENSAPDEDTSVDRAAVMLDLYLNTPDKGMNETPLHFASKFGALDVVKVLVSYSQCNREPINKLNHRPIDIVCSRVQNPTNELKNEIRSLLENEFYVPVLRSADQSVQPIIGEPFSPRGRPVIPETNPTRPPMEIHALAGPMSRHQAAEFRKLWRTPQKLPPPAPNHKRAPNSCPPAFRLNDCEKGLERAGRVLAEQHRVPWLEYWPFLDTFANLSSPEGLALLEDYLAGRFMSAHSNKDGFTTPSAKLFQKDDLSEDSVDEVVLRVSHDSLNSSGIEPEVLSPVTNLCSALKSLTIMDDSMGSGLGCGSPESIGSLTPSDTSVTNGDVSASSTSGWSTNFLDWNSRKTTTKPSASQKTGEPPSEHAPAPQDVELFSQPGLSPFLYVERSLKLFAKRIAASLLHVVSGSTVTRDTVCEVLHPEVKHIQNLVSSYMDDERFEAVGYQVVHSRIASSVAELLVNDLSKEECDSLVTCLSDVASKSDKKEAPGLSSDEDDELPSGTPYRQPVMCRTRTGNKTAQTAAEQCVALQTVKAVEKLTEGSEDTKSIAPKVRTETECVALWNEAHACSCAWPLPQQRHKRTPSAIKRERERIAFKTDTSNNSREVVPRLLQFEDESAKAEVEDDDAFYTPPSSLHGDSDIDSDEEMECPDEGPSVFIVGDAPTKLDLNVLHAISYCKITPKSHANIYRWKHSVELFDPEQRKRWPAANVSASPASPCTPPMVVDLPQPSVESSPSTPKSSRSCRQIVLWSSKGSKMAESVSSTPTWSRIIGTMSPQGSTVARGTPRHVLGSPSWGRFK